MGKKGCAFGFKLSALNKLSSMKASDKTTLMDFLVITIREKDNKTLSFTEDLEILNDVCALDCTYMIGQIGKFGGIINKIKKLSTSLGEEGKEDMFSKKMAKFLGPAK